MVDMVAWLLRVGVKESSHLKATRPEGATRLRNYPRTPFRTLETLENKGVPTLLG
jgi:hypothetical protein